MHSILTSRFNDMKNDEQGAQSKVVQALEDINHRLIANNVEMARGFADLKALSMNQMQVLTQLFVNESKIPGLFLIFGKEGLASYFLKSIGIDMYRLIFICESCMRPCRTGPKGNGFTIKVASDKFKIIAPALVLGLKFFLVAASVAGGISGIKLPLPSLTSIDALESTLEKARALVSNEHSDDVSKCAQSAFKTGLSKDEDARSLVGETGRIQSATGEAYKSLIAILNAENCRSSNYGSYRYPHHAIIVLIFMDACVNFKTS